MKSITRTLCLLYALLWGNCFSFCPTLNAGSLPDGGLGVQPLVASPTPPPQASAAGCSTLAFDEEFNGPIDVGYSDPAPHRWYAELDGYRPAGPCHYDLWAGHLTITGFCDPGFNGGVYLATQYAYWDPASASEKSVGTGYLGGYFEARMKCEDWSAFYLYSYGHPTVPENPAVPSTWAGEIDVIETDPSVPHTAVTTVHRNSDWGAGGADAQNSPNSATIPGSTIGQWHTYGVLWTQTQITWYVDNKQVCTAPAYPSDWQPMQLVLSAHPGGVGGGQSTVTPPTTEVDWVRVWVWQP